MQRTPVQLPSALTEFDRMAARLADRHLILCLDYDGTLTPIVENYNEAIISDHMRDLVQQLARKIPVAIISGRDVSFVKQHMRLPEAFYAGSHGFEIVGPENYRHELEEAERAIPLLDRAEEQLREFAAGIAGVEIERKKYAMAVHFRKANEEGRARAIQKVKQLLELSDGLIAGEGKMLLELKPAIDWHKGKALETIVEQLDPTGEAVVAFIGDDVTDEDAFRVLRKEDIGIFVGVHDRSTAASYRLNDVPEVGQFLGRLIEVV